MPRNRENIGNVLDKDPVLTTRRLRARSREVGIPNYMTLLMDQYNWKPADAAEYAGYYTRSLISRDVTMADEISFSPREQMRIAELEQKYGASANFEIFKQEYK